MPAKWLPSLATIVFATAAFSADVSELDKAPPKSKPEVIRKWGQALWLERATSKNKEAWTPPDAWQPIIKRMGGMADENPELVMYALSFFRQQELPLPECLTLCQAVLQSEKPALKPHKSSALQALLSCHSGDEKFVTEIILELDKHPFISEGDIYRLKNHPLLKTGLLHWLTSEHPSQRETAYRFLLDSGDTKVTPQLIDSLLEYMELASVPDKFFEQKSAVSTFARTLMKDSFTVTGLLSDGQLAKVRKLLPVVSVQECAAALLLVGSNNPPLNDLKAIAEAVRAGHLSGDLISTVGYWPALNATPQDLNDLLALTDQRARLARMGPISLYLRSGGNVADVERLFDQWKKADLPNWKYWLAFTGRDRWHTLLLPEKWKASDRYLVIESMHLLPDVPQAGEMLSIWIHEKGDKKDEKGRVLKMTPVWILDVVWDLRGQPGVKVEGLKEWLQETYANAKGDTSDHFQRTYAAALLSVLFNEDAALDETVTALGNLKGPFPMYLPRIVPPLLNLRPQCQFLDQQRELLAARTEPDTAWLLWLFDLRRGKEVGAPPLKSLVEAFSHSELWLKIFADADPAAIKPHLAELRQSSVGLATPGADGAFLGLLDRFELQK